MPVGVGDARQTRALTHSVDQMGREQNFRSTCLFCCSDRLKFKGKSFTLQILRVFFTHALCLPLWLTSVAEARLISPLASWAFPPAPPRQLAGGASRTGVTLPLPNLLPFLYGWCWSSLSRDRSCHIVFYFFFSDCSCAWFLCHINSVLETSAQISISSWSSPFLC